jgi:hypothetical protein
MLRNSVGKFWISHQNFNYPLYFSQSVGNYIGIYMRSEMHLIPALWNSHRPLVNLSVIINCWHIPTDCNPSAKSSVIVAFSPLFVKCRRTVIRQQIRRWLWHFQGSSLWNVDRSLSVCKVVGDGGIFQESSL